MRNGLARPEYEYEIPFNDAVEMMELFCIKPIIEKVRYKVLHNNRFWEIDVFDKENQGLITAEIEMENETIEIDIPEWIGLEVTDDPRYSNSNLVRNPYVNWDVKAKVIEK
jgi:CYTH domain-containing protein